jgi:uncharacterized iron-regulated protein
MKKSTILLSFLLLCIFAFNSDKPAYKLFNKKGNTAKYKSLLEAAAKADVVFFGELHDNPISHWLQYDLTRDLYNLRNGKMVLGAEMLEADNQLVLNEYLIDSINADTLAKRARLWPNFKTDYQPLVDFAKEDRKSVV